MKTQIKGDFSCLRLPENVSNHLLLRPGQALSMSPLLNFNLSILYNYE